jgi:hypothetical protein
MGREINIHLLLDDSYLVWLKISLNNICVEGQVTTGQITTTIGKASCCMKNVWYIDQLMLSVRGLLAERAH